MAQTPARRQAAADTLPAVAADAALPAHLAGLDPSLRALGNSQDAADNTIPFLAILQKGSPQVNRKKPEYIEGAEAGMLVNTALGRVFPGDTGVVVIPCGFTKNLVEWVPRTAGGGYVATHPFDLAEAQKRGAKRADGGIVLPSGNQLAETAYTFVMIDGAPAVIGATSSALRPMRDWMSLRNSFNQPSCARQYRLTTVYQENDKGDWFNWRVADLGWVTDAALFQRCVAFAQEVAAGRVAVGRPPDILSGDDSRDSGGATHNDGIPV